ncbi:unnamed protein product [Thlaspi arvense]|uniref:Thionin-like protein n=1 Tax=Thlaspi arvense TaxID=13288 RepID=A0AAU9RTU2_THLAR|nr:unnamed protein product [Thlaspi arvense]
MESKKIAVFMAMMLAIGNLIIETEAIDIAFPFCYSGCYSVCILNPFISKTKCDNKCIQECIKPGFEIKRNTVDQINHFCEIGCVTHRCVFVDNQNMEVDAEKTAVCANSCSDICNKKS